MKRLHILSLTCVCLGIAAVLLFRANTHAIAALPSNCGSWNVVASPNNGDDSLAGVATIAANDIWAVGDTIPKGSKYDQILIEHWNGTGWGIIPPAINHLDSTLSGVAAVSTNNVWAVGQTYGSTIQPIIKHWDGTTWSTVASPHLAEAGLNGVTVISANDIWVVGYYVPQNSPHSTQALIEHWNGSQWSVVPNPKNLAIDLYSVTALSTSNVWAVGSNYNGPHNTQTLIEHWDGSQWSVVPSPTPSSSHYHINYNFLRGVAASSATDIWAVGSYGNSKDNVNFTLIEHWNGTTWSIVPSTPTRSLQTFLSAVTVLSPTNIWAVGTKGSSTLTEHWNGTTWSIVPSPSPPFTGSGFYAVASVPGSNYVWAVGRILYSDTTGYYHGKTLTAYYC